MISKIFHLDSHFPTGELTVQPVLLWANGKPCKEEISKYASAGHDYFKTIEPIPGHSIVYVLAVSGWETYGENKNGDGFPEFPYKEDASPPWIAPDDVLPLHYKSFEQHGNNYRHHQNKDPKKAVGKVMKAFWNPTMHRVELLIDLDDEKAPDLAERIASGEFPPVSMGTRVRYDVCMLPGTLIRTQEGHKNIEDLTAGDLVRTHCGKNEKIKKVFSRTVRNEVLQVTANGVPVITCTKSHPFYTVKKENVRTCQGSANGQRLRHKLKLDSSVCARCNRTVNLKPVWSAAEDLRVGDYLLTPVDTCNDNITVGVEGARLLGLYVGGGCLYKSSCTNNLAGVALSLDTAHPRIIKDGWRLLEKLGGKENESHKYIEKGKDAVSLTVADQGLAQWLFDLGGEYSREKRLSENVFTWSTEEKKALVGGYIDSDGSFDKITGQTRIATVNRGLALDFQRILHSLEIPAYVSYGGHTVSEWSDTPYWYISISAFYSRELLDYAIKVEIPDRNIQWSNSQSFFAQGYWFTPIKKVEEIPGTTKVYNLSVSKDESYVAEGIAVHNCNICGNRAPTRAQYCDHLKFQMRQTLSDGKTVCALNPSAKFFDISWVFKPADPTAYMLKKVADNEPYEISGAVAGEYLDKLAERKLAAKKLAVIDKLIQGYPLDAKREGFDISDIHNIQAMRDLVLSVADTIPEFPDETLKALSAYPLDKIFSTLFAGGVSLSTPELVKMVVYKSYPDAEIGDDILDKCVIMQRPLMEFLEDCPQIMDQLEKEGSLDIDVNKVDVKIASLIDPYFEKRSGIPQYLRRQFVPTKYRDMPEPHTTPLSVTDPATGVRYDTTRGAALRAHDEIAKKNLMKVLGGTALLGGAYKLLGTGLEHIGKRKLKPLLGLSLAGLGVSQWPDMGPHYKTDQGVPVPTLTEMVPKQAAVTSSLALPALGTLAAMTALGLDYKSRLRRGEPIGHPALPLSRRLLDRVERFTYEHPIVTAVGGTATLKGLGRIPLVHKGMGYAGRAGKYVGQKGREAASQVQDAFRTMAKERVKVSELLEPDLPIPTGTVELPPVDMDKIATKIGLLIWEG